MRSLFGTRCLENCPAFVRRLSHGYDFTGLINQKRVTMVVGYDFISRINIVTLKIAAIRHFLIATTFSSRGFSPFRIPRWRCSHKTASSLHRNQFDEDLVPNSMDRPPVQNLDEESQRGLRLSFDGDRIVSKMNTGQNQFAYDCAGFLSHGT
jgi:hypothetical protein